MIVDLASNKRAFAVVRQANITEKTLRAENERLRAALRNIIAFHEITFVNDKGLEKAVLRTARAALEERT